MVAYPVDHFFGVSLVVMGGLFGLGDRRGGRIVMCILVLNFNDGLVVVVSVVWCSVDGYIPYKLGMGAAAKDAVMRASWGAW